MARVKQSKWDLVPQASSGTRTRGCHQRYVTGWLGKCWFPLYHWDLIRFKTDFILLDQKVTRPAEPTTRHCKNYYSDAIFASTAPTIWPSLSTQWVSAGLQYKEATQILPLIDFHWCHMYTNKTFRGPLEKFCTTIKTAPIPMQTAENHLLLLGTK